MALAVLLYYVYIVAKSPFIRLALSLFPQSKKLGKGKLEISCRLITENKLDLGQVYCSFTSLILQKFDT